MTIELDREDDGRWIAEVLEIPGCLVYGASRDEAVVRVRALAAEVLADRERHGE
jgi:predicted RNase H-like HicB family nuclease